MNGTRRCYEDALKRLRLYLTDSIARADCVDADACYVGIDSINKIEDAISAGEKPWESYDFDEDTQEPDGQDTAEVEADRCPVTLQRGYPTVWKALKLVQTALARWRDGVDAILNHPEHGPLVLEEVKYCVVDPALEVELDTLKRGMMPTNADRRARFAKAMRFYMNSKDGDGAMLETIGQEAVEEEITDFMTDMNHWHREQFGEPAPNRYWAALSHYEVERQEEGEAL